MTAAEARAARIAACTVKVGDVVNSVYGFRKVMKVNAKSVILEGGAKGVKLEKHLIINFRD